jgi:hypothetical protein
LHAASGEIGDLVLDPAHELATFEPGVGNGFIVITGEMGERGESLLGLAEVLDGDGELLALGGDAHGIGRNAIDVTSESIDETPDAINETSDAILCRYASAAY